MTELSARHCVPCEGGVEPLDATRAQALMSNLPDWRLSEDAKRIERELAFEDFHHTMEFVNAAAWIAHREDHHPDLEVGYRRCKIVYTTHAIGGLSENDFICAAKTDALLD